MTALLLLSSGHCFNNLIISTHFSCQFLSKPSLCQIHKQFQVVWPSVSCIMHTFFVSSSLKLHTVHRSPPVPLLGRVSAESFKLSANIQSTETRTFPSQTLIFSPLTELNTVS
ncbi:hypothetical protein NP493_262g01011 [Ridgeia piscesae]|uniref:Uncharacterized protein n=1 Tax=Ridgeia piscesae TaxID=27915 RepID=A0AAD9NY08_RIDPI|nr:hypothetical protein NP493_262g01011 [Ridgeia piscesae]